MPELHVDDGPPPLIEDDSGRAFRPRDPILPPPRTEGGFHIGERMSWQNETPTAEEWDSFDPIASDDNQSWSNVNETSSKYFGEPSLHVRVLILDCADLLCTRLGNRFSTEREEYD